MTYLFSSRVFITSINIYSGKISLNHISMVVNDALCMLYQLLCVYVKKSVNTGCWEATPSAALPWDYRRDEPQTHSNQLHTGTLRNSHIHTHTCTHQCRLLQYSRLQTHTHRGFPCETTLTQLSKFLPLACRLTHKQQLVTCCCQELWSCSSCGVSANFFFLPKYRDLHPSKACSKCVVSQVWVSGKLLQSQWKSLRICIILSL